MLDGQAIHRISLEEKGKISSDFIAFFTLNPGNPKDSEHIPINETDSIVVLIRGDIDYFLETLREYEIIQTEQHFTEADKFDSQFSEVAQITANSHCKGEIIIAAVGNAIDNNTANDYVLLYNKNSSCASLDGIYIGRDSKCSISTGNWTEYKALPRRLQIAPHSYYLISRSKNTLNSDFMWSGALSRGYCVVLSNSEEPPTTKEDPNIIQFMDLDLEELEVKTWKNNTSLIREGKCLESNSKDAILNFKLVTGEEFRPLNTASDMCIY